MRDASIDLVGHIWAFRRLRADEDDRDRSAIESPVDERAQLVLTLTVGFFPDRRVVKSSRQHRINERAVSDDIRSPNIAVIKYEKDFASHVFAFQA